MKRFLALALAAILVMGLASCGKQSATQSGQSSGSASQSSSSNKNSSQSGGSSGSQSSNNKNDSGKKVATAAQLVAALEKAGYMVEEDEYFESEYMTKEVHLWECGRWIEGSTESDYEGAEVYYFLFSTVNDAISAYNDIRAYYIGNGEGDESAGTDFSRCIKIERTESSSEFDGKIYKDGRTYIVSRVKETVIYVEVNWDIYRRNEMSYDHAAQKAIESLGY